MNPHSKSNQTEEKRRYQQAYRRRPSDHLCECGSRAVLYRSCGFLCATCAKDQDRKAFEALHRPTCGIPDSGLSEFALCLPGGMTL